MSIPSTQMNYARSAAVIGTQTRNNDVTNAAVNGGFTDPNAAQLYERGTVQSNGNDSLQVKISDTETDPMKKVNDENIKSGFSTLA